MSAKIGGLGRGFDSLIPTDLIDESLDPTADQDERLSELRHLKLADVVADPDQPRRMFDEDALQELARSVKEHGIVQPIIVTPLNGKYQIVAGERRYRAATIAGLEKIPALVRTVSDQHKLELSLIENIQRRDLNVLETATAYLKLRDQFNLSLDQIGERVGGKSSSAISNTLRLLRLPENVRQALQEGKLREGQARPLIGADPEVIDKVLPRILKEEWSARKIEQFIIDIKNADKAVKTTELVAPYKETSKFLTKRFGTNVKIRSNTRGSGQIVIGFKNDDEFQRISKLLDEQ
jgi:ParB family chromosome partitioning protein